MEVQSLTVWPMSPFSPLNPGGPVLPPGPKRPNTPLGPLTPLSPCKNITLIYILNTAVAEITLYLKTQH